MIYVTCRIIPDGDSTVGLYQKALTEFGQHNAEYIGEIYTRTEKSATQSLYSLLCLAELLRDANADPQTLSLKRAEGGKPYFEDNEWQFNISHSGNCVAVVLSNEGAVGIDIETANISEDKAEKMAKRFFTESEQAVVFEDPAAFCELWSKKEAIAKYFGMGLGNFVKQTREKEWEHEEQVQVLSLNVLDKNVILCASKGSSAPHIV
ncbi:MAG: 4'-phosphopantetheinyl transferase superfamily protein [Clostridia bacterium]|nr:4'-phosphopantetheinyl transferase superfamily protein [Clostridia bacterium]